MAGLKCPCGEVLRNIKSPSPIVYRFVSDALMDSVLGDPDVYSLQQAPEAWRCPSCGRIAIFDTQSQRAEWYMKECSPVT